TGRMGGLPDVNTENPDFQYYYMQYVNDVLACGARGFRYDTAKHIGLPSDPRDPKSPQNDFWDVAMGRKPVKGLSLAIPRDQLFIYGEVLQDKNVPEKGYAEYMDLTASNYGWVLRNVLNKHNANADNLRTWHSPVDPSHLITWVESHDTYCNEHASAGMSDELIRLGWVFLTARKYGTPLFYSRPHGSTRQNYWGDNEIGKVGNDEFKHPVVRAVNEFRHRNVAEPENIIYSANGKQIIVERGSKAAVVINLDEQAAQVEIPVTIGNGKYRDAVTRQRFQVKNGVLKATLEPMSAYILSK
ncbi:MAG: alpha-amylase, partial [Muribaculaceae bacterium]|nr:alpha-amylase [Muribaculaceae bacterium]